MKVLIVDDSTIMRKIISGVLTKLNVKDMIEAVDGVEAVAKASENDDIGLILMDWNMPNMSGIDAVKKIRADGNKVPIVMCTTEAEKERVIEAIKAGCNDYLIKPFNPKDIETKLEKFVAPCVS